MRVVVVVLDSPRLEWKDEWRKHDMAYNVLNEIVLMEAAVAAVVTNYEELRSEIPRGFHRKRWVRASDNVYSMGNAILQVYIVRCSK